MKKTGYRRSSRRSHLDHIGLNLDCNVAWLSLCQGPSEISLSFINVDRSGLKPINICNVRTFNR